MPGSFRPPPPRPEELAEAVASFGVALGVLQSPAAPASLEPGRGRPRDVTYAGCWLDHPDGSVSLVRWRRVGGAEGSWRELVFHGETEAAALAAFRRYSAEEYERITRHAARRGKWGVRELAG